MSDIVLHTAAKLETTKTAVVQRLANTVTRLREEDGQDMVEYAGVLIVVAVLILGVVVALKGSSVFSDIAKGMDGMINDIFTNKNPSSAS
jgi:Flp pilus assembly pilin Flp